MRNFLIGSTLRVLVVFAVLPLLAQSPSRPQPQAAKAIPDLSGLWEAGAPPTAENALCGIKDICEIFVGRAPFQSAPPEEPPMQPWAEERYKAAREVTADPDFGRQDLDTNFSGCMPEGPARFMLAPFGAFELRQFPDQVLLLSDRDHAVRRIYVDGRGHPDRPRTTWMGHSIGRYDGDTLIVDTIGINEKSWIDITGHPHSDALHLVERFRRVNQKSLEVEVTIDDPKAYKKPWTRKIVRQLALPGPRLWEGVLCEELLQMGTHYSAESKK